MVGAGYLCWIGLKALRDAYRGDNATQSVQPAKQDRTISAAFLEGFFTNALNPKVSMFYLAAFPQFMTVGDGALASAFLLVMIHSIINAVWFGAMVVLFAHLTHIAKKGSFQRWLKGITGFVFIGFGIKLASYQQ